MLYQCLVVKIGEKITTGILYNFLPCPKKKEVRMALIGSKQLYAYNIYNICIFTIKMYLLNTYFIFLNLVTF